MARNGNKIPYILKMLEKKETRMDERDKKIELMVTTLQTLIKSAPKEEGETIRRRNKKRKRALFKLIHK